MLSPKAKRNIARIIPFGLIWLLLGTIFYAIENMAIGDSEYADFPLKIDLVTFIFLALAITCVGFLVGVIELFLMDKLFAKKSFTKKILYKLTIYIFLSYFLQIITFPIAISLELNASIFDSRVWDKLIVYNTSITHLSNSVQFIVMLVVSIFYAQISDNIGHRTLMNFVTGKYHSPTEEIRIFMFSDMKSSTKIAEKLGHIRYFELLKEYYIDLSDAIIKYSGEIYQYIGDEIVVSWRLKAGLKNNNCINCFFAMKEDLRKRAGWYGENFSYIPDFKAGFHFGKVTTGEIGALKKEIIFTGDVLNTTARIQEKCNSYNVDNLVSSELIDLLNAESFYKTRELGEIKLRGREANINLFTIEQESNP